MKIDWLGTTVVVMATLACFLIAALLFSALWYLYYKTVKRHERDETDWQNLLTRGFVTVGMTTFAAMVFLTIGHAVTTRMAPSEPEIVTIGNWAGTYTRISYSSIPAIARKGLDRDDRLFIKTTPLKDGSRPLLKVYREDYTDKAVEMVAFQQSTHQPAKMFRWMGPIVRGQYVVKDQSGQRADPDFVIWTVIPSS